MTTSPWCSRAQAEARHFPALAEFADEDEAERVMALLRGAGLKAELLPPLATHIDDVGFVISVAPMHMGAAVRIIRPVRAPGIVVA